MEPELLQKIEQLARLLLTPQQIGDLLGLDNEEVAAFTNPYSEVGMLYRKILAEQAKDIHAKTMQLASVGSPSALEQAADWLKSAMNSIE